MPTEASYARMQSLKRALRAGRDGRSALKTVAIGAAAAAVIGASAAAAYYAGWDRGQEEIWSRIDSILAAPEMSPAFPAELDRNSAETAMARIPRLSCPDYGEIDKPFTVVSAEGAAKRRLQEAYDSLDHSVPDQVLHDIVRGAEDSGMDPVYLLAVASKESRMDVSASAGSTSATGPFQFTNATWMRAVRLFGAGYGLERFQKAIFVLDDGRVGVRNWNVRTELLALRSNTYMAAAMTAELAKDDRQRLEKLLGRQTDETDMYLLHLLGIGDAAKFIHAADRDPSRPAARVVPKAAEKNKPLFYDGARQLTLDEVRSGIRESLDARMASFRKILDNSKDSKPQTLAMLR